MLTNSIPSFMVPATIIFLLLITGIGVYFVSKAAPKQRAKKNKKVDEE